MTKTDRAEYDRARNARLKALGKVRVRDRVYMAAAQARCRAKRKPTA